MGHENISVINDLAKRLQSRQAFAYFGSAGFTTLIYALMIKLTADFLDEIQKKS